MPKSLEQITLARVKAHLRNHRDVVDIQGGWGHHWWLSFALTIDDNLPATERLNSFNLLEITINPYGVRFTPSSKTEGQTATIAQHLKALTKASTLAEDFELW